MRWNIENNHEYKKKLEMNTFSALNNLYEIDIPLNK